MVLGGYKSMAPCNDKYIMLCNYKSIMLCKYKYFMSWLS
jgi:hypothetical protein